MAAHAEIRMNLAALQQRDPYITDIVDTAKQVAVYSFVTSSNAWEKTEIEGTLFVYSRSASPLNGFVILNRLGPLNMTELIDKDLEFQIQDSFLLYRNSQLKIYGIWFYDKEECARIGQHMNRLIQVATEREKRASQERGHPLDSDTMDTVTQGNPANTLHTNDIDIVKMLTKAQKEFVVTKKEPKPLTDDSIANSQSLVRPLAKKAAPSDSPQNEPTTLDALFQNAAVTAGHRSPRQRSESLSAASPSTDSTSNQMPPLLQRLMSMPGSTVEEIERQQQMETTGDPLSPASELKRTLNIFPERNERRASPVDVIEPTPQSSAAESRQSVDNTQNLLQTPVLFSPREGATGSMLVHQENKNVSRSGQTKQTSHHRRRASSTSSGSINQLITPAELMQGPTENTHPVLSKKGSEVLITPSMFETHRTSPPTISAHQGTPTNPPQDVVHPVFSLGTPEAAPVASAQIKYGAKQDKYDVTPLTKEQIQQALLYLIKNDDNFINTLHEAYVNSLKRK